MINNTVLNNELNKSVRQITGRVELYLDGTLVNTFSHNTNLISFDIERIGDENKFFGYGVCQKVNVKVIDRERIIKPTTAQHMRLYFNDVRTSPKFYVTEVHRDEKTGEISITAYDKIYFLNNSTVSQLAFSTSYTIKQFAQAVGSHSGMQVVFPIGNAFDTNYPNGANFDGTETLRDALDDVAEATSTIYYINHEDKIVFKQLNGEPVLTIDKSKYFDLSSKTNRRLVKIVHVTELGDNVGASLSETGSVQYIRNNAFWDLRDDIGTLVNQSLDRIGGFTINQFECEWRGNPLLEIGDRISIITKDNESVFSNVLNDTISYDGSLSEKTEWSYENEEETEEDNPSDLGEALTKTYARVDKVNKEITLLASEVSDNKSEISEIKQNVDNISLTIKSTVQEVVKGEIGNVSLNVYTIVLSNEAQTIAVNNDRFPLTNETFTTVVQVYEGSNVRTDYEIGDIASANGITVSKTNSRVDFAVSTSSALTADNGTFTIPITIDGKTFNKTFSWSCSKQGNAGVDGADGKALNIHASSQIFKSVGDTYEPSIITLTPKCENVTFSKWQYSLDGTTWNDVVSGTHGLTLTDSDVVITYGEIVLSKTSSSIEKGSTDTFTVKLNQQPTNNQTVTLSVNNSNVSINKTSLTFTPSNYNTAQSVTISGATVGTSTITLSSPNVSSKSISVTVTEVSQDVTYGNIVVSKTSSTIEKGSTDTFTVKLDKAPTNNQTVTLTTSNSNASINKTSLTFTPNNYSIAQTITITGSSVGTATITLSSDNVPSKTVSVKVLETQTEPTDGIEIVCQEDNFTVQEGSSYYVSFSFRGTIEGEKTLAISCNDSKINLSPSYVTVRQSNINDSFYLTLYADTTDLPNGRTAKVTFSGDGFVTKEVTFTIKNNNGSGGTATYGEIIISNSVLTINEGSTTTFTVRLATAPTSNQIVNVSVGSSSVATVSPSTLTFTPSNYSTNQTVTVNAIKDSTSYVDNSTQITLTSNNVESKTISLTVKNTDTETIPVTGLNVSEWDVKLEVGQQKTLTYNVIPTNATNQTVYWSNTNSGVATISNTKSTITINAVGVGYTCITGTTAEGNFTYDIHVNVSQSSSGGGSGSTDTDTYLPLEDSNVRNLVPYLSTYYIKPTVKTGEEIILNYFVTDYYGRSYTNNSNFYNYKIIVKRDGKQDIVTKNVSAGDHSVSLGSYSSEGTYHFSIIAIDQYGRKSHELFNYIRVRNADDIHTNVYNVTDSDLSSYSVTINNDKEEREYVTVSSANFEKIEYDNQKEMVQSAIDNAYNNGSVSSGKYKVFIPMFGASSGTDYKGKTNGWKCLKVKYGSGFDVATFLNQCATNRQNLQRLISEKANAGYNKIVLRQGTYMIDNTPIDIPNGITLDLNGSTIKMCPITGNGALMMRMTDCTDTHLCNGTIEGDYFAHDYAGSTSNSEWVSGVEMAGSCRYCSIRDLTIKNITGYGLQNSISSTSPNGNTFYGAIKVADLEQGDIDRETGQNISCAYRLRSGVSNISAYQGKSEFISMSIHLNYQGNEFSSWNYFMYFYDSGNNFIQAVSAYQYRQVKIPQNAYYVRIVILGERLKSDWNLHYQFFRVPTHCEFRNITIDNARCVGMAQGQMKDFLVQDCIITNSGQSSATCSYDAEDGWDGMQDVFFENFRIYDCPNNGFLTCAGHNFVINNMNSDAIYMWERMRWAVIKNSTFTNGCVIRGGGEANIVQHGVTRFYDNTVLAPDYVNYLFMNVAKNCTYTTAPRNGIMVDSSVNGNTVSRTVYNNDTNNQITDDIGKSTDNVDYGDTGSQDVPVSKVTLNKTSISLTLNGTEQLVATVFPTNASNQGVTWSSSDTNIASVSSSGLVTGKGSGSATITVKTDDGGYTATCSVQVTSSSSGGTVASLNPVSCTIKVGDSQTFTLVNTSATIRSCYVVTGKGTISNYSSTSIIVQAISEGTEYLNVVLSDDTSLSATITISANTSGGGSTGGDGGGSDSSDSETDANGLVIIKYPASQKPKPTTWCAMGDSITAGTGAGGSSYSYANVCANLAGITAIHNHGIAGSCICAGYNTALTEPGVETAFCNRFGEMSASADLITVLGSVNDHRADVKIGSPTSTDKNDFYGALYVLITGLKQRYPNGRIVFITPFKISGWNGKNMYGFTLQDFRNAIVTQCNRFQIEVVDLFSEEQFSWLKGLHQGWFYAYDYYHPTAEGHQAIASWLKEQLFGDGSSSGGGDDSTGGSTSSGISNPNDTALTQQYSSSHEATPNIANPPSGSYNWKYAPRINPDGSFPNSTWNAFGHWMTTYKIEEASYYDNVGLLLQNPKAWIWNTSTKSWDVLSSDFEWGSWYLEDFYDDGNSTISNSVTWEKGASGNHSTWVKIKQDSTTQGRCFHPWGYQKDWRSNSSWSNNGQPYIVTKVDFKLVKYDENGADNLDSAQLVVNSGGDWWSEVGATWKPDWSTNRDMCVGKYIKATRELKRAWATNLPSSWSYGLPTDDSGGSSSGGGTNIPVTGITVDAWDVKLQVGQTRQMVASVIPSDATNQTIYWTTSATDVATVSSNGLITAKKEGYSLVVATTADGNHSYNIHVNVSGSSSGGGGGDTGGSSVVTPSEATMAVGSTQRFTLSSDTIDYTYFASGKCSVWSSGSNYVEVKAESVGKDYLNIVLSSGNSISVPITIVESESTLTISLEEDSITTYASVTPKKLVISNTSDLFTSDVSSVVFKALATDNNYYDTMTIIKLTDLSDELKGLEGEVIKNQDAIASLQLNTDSINASVQRVEETFISTVDGINTNISSLTEKVNATMTSEDVKIEIQKEMANGTSKVSTSTGFTFDENGLRVSKSDSEMNTQITEDGMKIYKNDEVMLTANNQGVDAKNLHATTYLIIGGNSRMEDFTCDGTKRTAVFWIGSDN